MLTKKEIKHIHELRLKKFRKLYSQYIVEGEKMVAEAIQYQSENVSKIYCTNSFIGTHTTIELEKIIDRVVIINEMELKSISELKTPHQAVAVVEITNLPISANSFYLALDGIQDPGNLGTIIRLADWFGLTEIICSKDCVDVYNNKVIQATMGSVFRVCTHYVDLDEWISDKKLPVYGALLQGDNIYQTSLKRKGILLVGNEGNGIREEILPKITNPITIPKFGNAESLNVGMATGIILSEFFRNPN